MTNGGPAEPCWHRAAAHLCLRPVFSAAAATQLRLAPLVRRYGMYIESQAYASNLRQKLVCGSPVLALQMTHYEWWSRALQAGTHFIQARRPCRASAAFASTVFPDPGVLQLWE